MNREPAARQLVSPDGKVGLNAHIQDLVDPCGGVAERSACIPEMLAKRNAH
jgi:hypothetical protein